MAEQSPSPSTPPGFMPRGRPKTLEEFRAQRQFGPPNHAPESFKARPTDLLIATYPKSGTTWTQQIIHGLRTRGSMDFEEISLAVPWIETAPMLGIDLDAPQAAEPRAFKTHLSWDKIPKGGRYITVMRDPGDALVSLYHFGNGMIFEAGAIDLDTFCFELCLTNGPWDDWWSFVKSWWEQRHREDVLFLSFEDMKADHEGAVRRIADFMGLKADEELISLATRQSTIEFMRAHDSQFDEHPMARFIARMMGAPSENAKAAKVRSGRVGESNTLSPRIQAALAERWKREMEGPLGVRSYDELRAKLRAGE